MNNVKIYLIAVLSLSLAWSPTAKSQDLDVKVCAEVLPCTDNGEVLEEFRAGPCYATYQELCSAAAPTEIAAKRKLLTCRASNASLRKLNDRLIKQLRHARKLAKLVN